MSLRRALRIASAWLDARLAEARIRDRDALERRQARLLKALQPALAATPALAPLAGRPLDEFPVRDPSEVRKDLEGWNSLGLTAADITAAANASEAGTADRNCDVQAGFSTGSASARGVFLTTAAERERYIGLLLGRLIRPARLLRPIRAALILRANNGLYEEVRGTGAAFAFIGLDQPPEAQRDALAAFCPTHLIAPPHALAAMARLADFAKPPGLEAVFYGAEPMGDRETDDLATAYGVRPLPLYQATEGFLASPCALGELHLNEHDLIVELEAVDQGRFRPVVTDLRRRSQPIVRVRLDDLITPAPPCACGSPRRAILPVEGRVQEFWRFDGAPPLFPREIVNAVEAALPPLAPWQAEASSRGVTLKVEHPDHTEPGLTALRDLLSGRGIDAPVAAQVVARIETWPKRRRVRWAA